MDSAKSVTIAATDTTGKASEQYYLTVNKDSGVNTATSSQWVNKGSSVTVTATAKSGYKITSGTGSTGTMNAAKTVNVTSEPIALKFSSDSNFTLSVASKGWDGTLQYSTNNGSSWATWDGSQLSGTASKPIYIRGTGNSKITGPRTYKWTFTGKYCTGNIETLLDYQKVINGQHPTMAAYCYAYMFDSCTSITTAPSLPATTMTDYCYASMFFRCTSLITAPSLPATTLANYCYSYMFLECASLTTAPSSLPATVLKTSCYYSMFDSCTSLTTAPSLPATGLVGSCYQYMFNGCTKLKVSEGGSGTKIFTCPSTSAANVASMFHDTGGTFRGNPTAGKTYYYY